MESDAPQTAIFRRTNPAGKRCTEGRQKKVRMGFSGLPFNLSLRVLRRGITLAVRLPSTALDSMTTLLLGGRVMKVGRNFPSFPILAS